MIFKNLKAQSSRHVLALMAACTMIGGGPAFAQGAAPVFVPVNHQWDVGATQLSNIRGLKDTKLPCVLSNEFDNGFLVRLSGGGQQFYAMAVDFRQNVFSTGQKYKGMIAIGDGYVQSVEATAFTPTTLIFNLRPLNDFYAHVEGGGRMEISLEGNTLKFDLGQISRSFDAMEACYQGAPTDAVKPMPGVSEQAGRTSNAPMALTPQDRMASPPVAAPPSVPAAQPKAAALPKSFDDIVASADEEGAYRPYAQDNTAVPSAQPSMPRPAPVFAMQPAQDKKAQQGAVEGAAKTTSSAVPPVKAPETSRVPAVAAPVPRVPEATAMQPVPVPAQKMYPPAATTPAPVSATVAPAAALSSSAAVAGRVSRASEGGGKAVNTRAPAAMVAMSTPPAPSSDSLVSPKPYDSSTAGASAMAARATPAPVGNVKPVPPPVSAVPAAASAQQAYSRAVSRRLDTAYDPSARTASPVAANAQKWTANAGEDIRSVLGRWAGAAGYDLDWQSAQDGTVQKTKAYEGSFDQAVAAFLYDNGQGVELKGQVKSAAGSRDIPNLGAGGYAVGASEGYAPSADITPIPTAMHYDWSAQRGSNLQSVIDEWAAQSGVYVVWQDYMSFPVKTDLSLNGNFEQAVERLLDQYRDDSPRPVAQLNVDPGSGLRTLLMMVDQ